MSKKKFLIKTIEAFEKHEFDKVVKIYLKEIYNYIRIVITDGKDDTGIDLKVFDLADQKIQYQITTQKSETTQEKKKFEEKLFDDVNKAKENFESYDYSNSLFFFYSKALTNKVIRSFEKKAIQEYGITLTIIEANRIAEESEEFLQLQKTIIETNDWSGISINKSVFPNDEKNLLFDLVSFGKPSDFKLQIIEAFVLQLLYQKKQLSFEGIVNNCQEEFKGKDNDIFYQKLFARLQSSRKITKTADKLNFVLVEEEEERIKTLKELFELDEKELLINIKKILEKFNQESLLEEYVLELKKIYVDNFNSDILNIVNDPSMSDLSKVSRDFVNFTEKNLGKEHDAKKLAISLFEYCKSNSFLQKFSASKVFSEKTNLSTIEKYVNTQKKIFLDTQIGLHALCYFYNPKSEYKNYFFQTTKSLLSFCRKNQLKLFIPERYVWEIQNHLIEALNLVPFTHLPNFEKLGKSKNVIYNFYLDVKSNTDPDLKYVDFFENFSFGNDDRRNNLLITDYLENAGIELFHQEKKYDINDTIDLIQYELRESKRFKTSFSIINDSIMLEFLADNDVAVHPLQPIFLTWDKSFFKVQNKFYKKNPTSQRWFLMTPGKFIDQYSLLQFSINSEAMSNEILALLSNEIIQSTHTLLDTIVTILNPNDEIGLEYTNKLADIRDNEIHRIKENEIMPPDELEGEAVIDDVFYRLTDHFRHDQSKLNSFRNLFTHKEYMNTILELIKSIIDDVYTNKKFNENIYKAFDDLILKNSSISIPDQPPAISRNN